MLILELRDRIRRGLLEFSWRQWAQVGVSANIVGFDRWAIDPEALILFTIEVARRDPRLFDEMLDWIVSNRRLLTMQRLRNLTIRFPVDPDLVRGVLAWADESIKPLQEVGSKGTLDKYSESTPVFNQDILGFVANPDPYFAASGYIRPTISRSGKSREPDVHLPVNLAFQLRHLFGPGSRSEVMRVLLTFTDGPPSAARIADESAFARRNVNDTLASLVESRVVKTRGNRNERVFLAYRKKWSEVLEFGPSEKRMPIFVSWVNLLPLCLQVMFWLEKEAETTDSEYLVASRARDLTERVVDNLESVGLDSPLDRLLPGAAYLTAIEDMVGLLLESLRV